MNILLLKLILGPIIIGSASLAGRKWGAAVSGWIVGLPLTSGPVTLIVALSHDRAFASETIRGVMSGGFSLIIYALAYAWVAKYFNWKISFTASVVAFISTTLLIQNITIPLIQIFFFLILVILLGVRFMPNYEPVESTATPGKWDIPSRILLGTSFIIFVTAIAPYIGPRLTGLLTTIPLYVSILTIFAHRHDGSAGGINVLRGLVYGLFAFASFYLVLGLLIEGHSLTVSFSAAVAAALFTQGITLLILNQSHK